MSAAPTPGVALEPQSLDPATLRGPVWVVSPHPDDEALGCGALLAALSALGTPVHALLLTDGGASHPNSRAYPRARLAEVRLAEWRAGLDALGVPAGRSVALGLPDGALGACEPAGVTRAVSAAFGTAPPQTVLLPWRRDPHPDHRAAWGPVRAATPPGARVLEYAVWLPERGEAADHPAPGEARTWQYAPSPAGRAAKARAVAAHASQQGLIRDDPAGFILPRAMVGRAVSGPEQYVEAVPAPEDRP